MSGKYQAPSVGKAFSILRQIARSPKGLNLSYLANQLKMSKGTAHGIIGAMVEEGALIRDTSSKRYFLGPTLFELGKAAYSELDLREIVGPIMEELMEQTGTSVFFGISNGRRVSILDVVESNHDLKITAPRGSTVPLLAGAVGKIFLASMDPEQANSIIGEKGIPRFTARTVTDPDAYGLEVSRAKKNGYASDDEEYIDGVRAAAAPIRGKLGRLYAIWAVGFKSALDDHMMRILETEILEAAEKLTQQINDPPPFTPPNA